MHTLFTRKVNPDESKGEKVLSLGVQILNAFNPECVKELAMNDHFIFPEYFQDYVFKVMAMAGEDPHMRDYGLKIVFNYIHGMYLPSTLSGADFLDDENDGDINKFFKSWMDAPYPYSDDLYLMKKSKVMKVTTNVACKFSQIRK